MSVTITWSAVVGDADAPSVTRRTTEILSVVPPAPAEAAATALKWWLEESPDQGWSTNWDNEAGDEPKLKAFVVVHEPPLFSGTYEIDVERVLQTSASPADPDDAANVAALLEQYEEA